MLQLAVKKTVENGKFEVSSLKTKSMTSEEEQEFLSDAARARDISNNGMARGELISLIMEISGCDDRKEAENHYDYLIRKKKLSDLKKSTTKHSQIVIEQQLWWHSTIEQVWEDTEFLNQPREEFRNCWMHFQANLDETGINDDEGTTNIIGGNDRKKHEKNMADNRDSITIICTGNAAGTSGPWNFLATGKKMEWGALRQLPESHGAPPGFKAVMPPTAYLTDESWAALVPTLCKGIRDMAVVRDHPNWWICLTLDGYSSPITVTEALIEFHKHKIFIVKEEGDTSAVNQPYDQFVAKSN
jgi:hypothetical protein